MLKHGRDDPGAAVDEAAHRRTADRYAAYLETPAGKLRLEVAYGNLREFLPAAGRTAPARALDLGAGTGWTAVRLAAAGFLVTAVDHSPFMLDFCDRAARRAGVSDRVALARADVVEAARLLPARSFDVIVCHHVLEYLDDPGAALAAAAALARQDRPAIVSLVVRSRAGEAVKTALVSGDLEAAGRALTAETGVEPLCGARVRLFTPHEMEALLARAALQEVARRGVRVLADYLPAPVRAQDDYDRIVAFERRLGTGPEFVPIARYQQWLARPEAGGAAPRAAGRGGGSL